MNIEHKPGQSAEPKERKQLIDFFVERARELQAEVEKTYAAFHENPELGGEEFETARRVKTFLEEIGVDVVGENIGGTGVVGVIRGSDDGPTVALRADMDALPVQESSYHKVRSQKDGVMHACGHDMHTASLMGAARILKEMADRGDLPGNVVLLFQPSEEKAHQKQSGAVRMVRFLDKAGMRKDIGAFIGLHVARMFERGQINVKDGVQMASSGEVDIKLTGPGGHIMDAYTTPNLHILFSEITMRLSNAFKELYEKGSALVASRGTDYAGSGYNVLPAEAESTWVVRVASPLYKQFQSDIVRNIRLVVDEVLAEHRSALEGSHLGGGSRISATITPHPGYRPVIHRDKELVTLTQNTAMETVKGAAIVEQTLMGGEDFSFYLEEFHGKEIPGVFVMVGAAKPDKGIPIGSHHAPDFRVDTNVLSDMTALYSTMALKTIEHLRKEQ